MYLFIPPRSLVYELKVLDSVLDLLHTRLEVAVTYYELLLFNYIYIYTYESSTLKRMIAAPLLPSTPEKPVFIASVSTAAILWTILGCTYTRSSTPDSYNIIIYPLDPEQPPTHID